jgi:hypothetical protein
MLGTQKISLYFTIQREKRTKIVPFPEKKSQFSIYLVILAWKRLHNNSINREQSQVLFYTMF